MKKSLKIIIIIVAVLAILGGVGLWSYKKYQDDKIVTIITMDINPSIEISLNKNDKVVKVNALNDDGKQILKEKKFKGETLTNTINSISNELVEQEYITSENNLVLISVSGKEIKEEVEDIVTESLKTSQIEVNIIIPNIEETDKEKALQYGIAPSKSSYIEDIIETNEDLTFEELKDKTINEIDDLVKEKEEQRKLEEQKKIEEQKKVENTEQRYGSDAICETVPVGLTNEEAMAKAYAYLNKENPFGMFMDAQTIGSRYNGICAYETKVAHNQKLYTIYYNITTGELVHVGEIDWKAGSSEDIAKIVKDYLMTKYGAFSEQIQMLSSGGTVNDSTKHAQASYNGVTYSFVIKSTTGEILAVTN